jgi:Uma2 family endonuclease
MSPLQNALPLPSTALRPITVDEYHTMADAGVFRPDERVELLDGHLLPMSPVAGPHFVLTNRLNTFFGDYRRGRYQISVQAPIRLDDRSEPEPDLALLRPGYDDEIAVAHAADVLLVVEVSASTLDFDRDAKRPRYAAAGIPEVWIVAAEARYVEVGRALRDGIYTRVERFDVDDDRPLVPAALPDLPPLDLKALFRGMEWDRMPDAVSPSAIRSG